MDISRYKIAPNSLSKRSDFSTEPLAGLNSKRQSEYLLIANIGNIENIVELHTKLYAQNDYAVLLIFQAMDTVGKDRVIKRVMAVLNPQSTHVYSCRVPSDEELNLDYLWRTNKHLP